MGACNYLLARCGQIDPTSIAEYEAHDGYAGLRRAVEIGAEAVIAEVTASGLIGRGGAAFPTGRKWAAVAAEHAERKFVIGNADESEPGTFKDRKLLEEDPFALIEAMTIAGLATGAHEGIIYIRGEYLTGYQRLVAACAAARAHGYLGAKILNTGYAFDIDVHRGGGAYICGEEMALISSLEGLRGEPRSKPPFPIVQGLFRKPTMVNNVETLVNIPLILRRGAAWYNSIGVPSLAGPKLFSLSGHIAKPGVYEVTGGTPLRELLDLAGGMPPGRTLQTVLLGGAAAMYIMPDQIDVSLDYAAIRALGATIGSGAVIVFDDSVNIWEMACQFAEFFAEESCGQCVPCRVGTQRQVEILHRVVAGRASSADIERLKMLGQGMGDASICGLGQAAAWQVLSALEHFPLPANPQLARNGAQPS